MKASKTNLIQKKVLNELSEFELTDFNRLIESDSDFAKEYAMAKELMTYVGNEELLVFRGQLEKVSKSHKSKNSNKRLISLRRHWSYVASVAAVALILFGSYVFLNENSASDKLFDQYYNTDEVFLNTRSGSTHSNSVLEQGLVLFEDNKFEESIDYFEQLPTSVTALYYSGVAHMEIGEYEVAEFKFDQVISNYLNVFYDQAQWYKGLCLVKQNKKQEANVIFTMISQSNSYYKEQALELTKQMK
ncbi:MULTISPECIES: tol-pal system YbgF family protein [unclassified Lentimicrobium]|uniref:tetratricopeptide repeat protein n=1 Tax=unclassified Lentimicrobium TaxID=2677434 RepID=UPI0015559F5B|nr:MULTISPECIES: tetratricopeptide repeat protein [unclassified Lentimicrobium]NPD46477.1 tetratricopeptide repeat protein [Lentimicrobium sp. S6]NPD85983.1 tetratricopeptide repeat protein [Lentimicrobium sp. L6]